MDELKFSKRKQLYHNEIADDTTRDKAFRRCMILLDFISHNFRPEVIEEIIKTYSDKDLDHIDGKGCEQLRYGITNFQFLERTRHRDKHDTGKHSDLRSEYSKEFFDKLNFTG